MVYRPLSVDVEFTIAEQDACLVGLLCMGGRDAVLEPSHLLPHSYHGERGEFLGHLPDLIKARERGEKYRRNKRQKEWRFAHAMALIEWPGLVARIKRRRKSAAWRELRANQDRAMLNIGEAARRGAISAQESAIAEMIIRERGFDVFRNVFFPVSRDDALDGVDQPASPRRRYSSSDLSAAPVDNHRPPHDGGDQPE